LKIKVLGICGSPFLKGNTERLLEEALKGAEMVGAETELIPLADKRIEDCNQDNWCMNNSREGKYCSIEDDMVEIYPKVLDADALILASPTYITRMTPLMAKFLDRLRTFAWGNCRGLLRNKVGAAVAVAWHRYGGVETTLMSMVQAFLLFEMVIASVHHSGAYYGAGGVSSLRGSGEFDPKDKLQILKDDVGMRAARDIGIRTVELARIVKAGTEVLIQRALADPKEKSPYLFKIGPIARKRFGIERLPKEGYIVE